MREASRGDRARAPTEPRQAAPVAFPTAGDLRAWLERHHATRAELVIRCYKVKVRHRGVTYAQALDEALCFGWIDGVRRALDDDTFTVRFTPRTPTSRWSAVNMRHVARLEAEGRMREPGRAAFRARRTAAPAGYSYEARAARLAPEFARRLRADAKAWAFFRAQPPWYRRTSVFWVMQGKRADTRARRFETLLTCSARGVPVPPLARTTQSKRAAP